MDKTFLWSIADGIGRLTFNRPDQANSIGLDGRDDMVEAVGRIAASDARVVVLTGAGKMFRAGGDIGEFLANKDRIGSLVGEVIGYVHATILTLARLPNLRIAFSHGGCSL